MIMLVNWNTVNMYSIQLLKLITDLCLLQLIIHFEANLLEVATKNYLRSSAWGFTIDNIVSMVTYPIRRNKLLKMHDRRSQK